MTSDTNRSTASKPAPELTPGERKDLRAAAHSLHPVVTIGDAGLSRSVLAEVERALDAHGLIKIRVHGDDRVRREALLGEVCARAHCAPVQMIGKLLVVWRPKRETGTGGDAGTSRRTAPRQPKKLVGARTEEGASKPTSAASRHRAPRDLAAGASQTRKASAARPAGATGKKVASLARKRPASAVTTGPRSTPAARSAGPGREATGRAARAGAGGSSRGSASGASRASAGGAARTGAGRAPRALTRSARPESGTRARRRVR